MGEYTVWVYAICRDEAPFVPRWMASMGEADGIAVLDTGSRDTTAEDLAALGARVTKEVISPWRFDAARSRSLELVPEEADICVCTDLDEVFRPGWRQALEAAWAPDVKQLRYPYIWSFNPDGTPGSQFWQEKVHSRRGWTWAGAVHECLKWQGEGEPRRGWAPGALLEHHPDPRKSRGQYLPLLEVAAAEAPEDDRLAHYLGREYFFYGRWADCVGELTRHLALPRAVWADERAASMDYLARACAALGREEEARGWFLQAMAQAPHLREPLVDLASFLMERGEWDGVVWLCRRALALTQRPRSYLCRADAWGWAPHDLLSLGLFYTGRRREALEEAERAAALAPWDPRLRDNVSVIRARLEG